MQQIYITPTSKCDFNEILTDPAENDFLRKSETYPKL